MSEPTTPSLEDFELRRVPLLGGFSLTFIQIEVRRLLRNRRTVIITFVMPVVLFLIFRNTETKGKLAHSGLPDLAAITMVGVAIYGAMLAATSGGAMVSVERALGWSRQLRLTPMRPVAYVAIKVLLAMLLGLASVLVVFVAGIITGVQMDTGTWMLCGLLAWIGALVFSAFGLFMGYLLPTENVMQILGPILGLMAFFGGLFVPVSLLPQTVQILAPFMPTYGVAAIARFPLLGGNFDPIWLLSLLGWTAAFAVGATILFRRDPRRV